MNRPIRTITLLLLTALLSACTHEFNQVYKSSDNSYRYEYAKESFVRGKYAQACSVLEDVVTMQKGTTRAEESLFMLGMAEFLDRDYESASLTFKKYTKTYPKGIYVERAYYYIGESLYKIVPEPRLDQTETVNAIAAYQDYLDLFPDASLKDQAQSRIYELQDVLVRKELLSAQLYYNLGTYFGNCTSGGSNYEACIITAQNAIKDYPYNDQRESFALLVMKSKYELAQQSVEEKKMDRYRDAIDECYGFINEYPESKNVALAERYIAQCKKATRD